MIHYLKRIPLVYEAIQWRGDETELAEFMKDGRYIFDAMDLVIKTKDHLANVIEGDWILRDGLGRWWVVADDELLQDYAQTTDEPEYLPHPTADKGCRKIPVDPRTDEEKNHEHVIRIESDGNMGSVCPDSTLEVRSDPGIYPPEQGQLLITKEAALKNISAALKELKNAFMLTEDDGK